MCKVPHTSKNAICYYLIEFWNFLYTNKKITVAECIFQGAMFGIFYLLYTASRAGPRLLYQQSQAEIAINNANNLYNFEKILHIDYEKQWQTYVLHHSFSTTNENINDLSEISSDKSINIAQGHWILTFAYFYYFTAHFLGTFIIYFLMAFWSERHDWKLYYRLFWICNILATLCFFIYPLAPPRLSNVGIIDTALEFRHKDICSKEFNDQGLANCYAAMPSVHCIWSLLTSLTVIRFVYYYKIYPAALPILPTMNGDVGNDVGNGITSDDAKKKNAHFSYPSNFILLRFLSGFRSRYRSFICNTILKVVRYLLLGLAVVYFGIMVYVVIITGNHWVLDIIPAPLFLLFAYYIHLKTVQFEISIWPMISGVIKPFVPLCMYRIFFDITDYQLVLSANS